MNSKRIITIICCLIGWQSSSGQAPPDNQELDSFKRWQANWNTRFDSTIKPKVGVYPKKPADALYTFKVAGNYRFFSCRG